MEGSVISGNLYSFSDETDLVEAPHLPSAGKLLRRYEEKMHPICTRSSLMPGVGLDGDGLEALPSYIK